MTKGASGSSMSLCRFLYLLKLPHIWFVFLELQISVARFCNFSSSKIRICSCTVRLMRLYCLVRINLAKSVEAFFRFRNIVFLRRRFLLISGGKFRFLGFLTVRHLALVSMKTLPIYSMLVSMHSESSYDSSSLSTYFAQTSMFIRSCSLISSVNERVVVTGR